jgi:hypothetical protein
MDLDSQDSNFIRLINDFNKVLNLSSGNVFVHWYILI